VAAAERVGITAETLNSPNREEWQRIIDKLLHGEVACLLVSPERLATQDFIETCFYHIADRLGLLLCDYAPSLSDWGHAFRSDY
ncbi:recombinase RecQ, partial [Escherichia coli]